MQQLHFDIATQISLAPRLSVNHFLHLDVFVGQVVYALLLLLERVVFKQLIDFVRSQSAHLLHLRDALLVCHMLASAFRQQVVIRLKSQID